MEFHRETPRVLGPKTDNTVVAVSKSVEANDSIFEVNEKQ